MTFEKIILARNKGYSPNYTEEVIGYLNEFTEVRTMILRKKKNLILKNFFDWNVMTI